MIKRVERKDGPRFEVYSPGPGGQKKYVGTFATRRAALDAEEEAKVTRRKIERGELAPETNVRRKLRQASDEWLTSLEKRGSRSHEGYSDRMRIYIWPKLGELELTGLTFGRLVQFRDELAVSGGASGGALAPATVNGVLVCLSSALSYFVKRQWLTRNPAQDVELIERPDRQYTWIQTREEITKLLGQCVADHRDIVATALGTGMRLDELTHLQWADVDLERRLIAVHRGRKGTTKSGRARRVPILDAILPMLRERALHRDGQELVFPGAVDPFTKRAKPRSKPGVRDAFKLAVQRAGLDTRLRFHDLRHTFASHWILDQGDVFSLSKVLGHHSVTVTEKVYAHLRPDHWEKDYGRVAFLVPREAKVYEFTRGTDGRISDRVVVDEAAQPPSPAAETNRATQRGWLEERTRKRFPTRSLPGRNP